MHGGFLRLWDRYGTNLLLLLKCYCWSVKPTQMSSVWCCVTNAWRRSKSVCVCVCLPLLSGRWLSDHLSRAWVFQKNQNKTTKNYSFATLRSTLKNGTGQCVCVFDMQTVCIHLLSLINENAASVASCSNHLLPTSDWDVFPRSKVAYKHTQKGVWNWLPTFNLFNSKCCSASRLFDVFAGFLVPLFVIEISAIMFMLSVEIII